MKRNAWLKCLFVFLAFLFVVSGWMSSSVQAEVRQPNDQLRSLSFTDNTEDHGGVIEGEYIIAFQDGLSTHAMKRIVASSGGQMVDGSYDLQIVTLLLTKTEADKLAQDEAVLSVEPNQVTEVTGDVGAEQYDQYGLDLIKIQEAWSRGLTGAGIKVAVMDTGVAAHDALEIAGGVSFMDYTDSYVDDNGHGTHVAGIIGAQDNGSGVTGVADAVELYAVKVLDEEGFGSLMDILKALDWAIEHEMDVANISLGVDNPSPALEAKVTEAVEAGVAIVAATGNESKDTIMYPARYEQVIAVGATDEMNKLASFSNTGEGVDVVAPGVNIVSTYLDNTYVLSEGTSQATPHVSGMLALLMEEYPEKTVDELKDLIFQHTIDLGPEGKDDRYGHGLVQYPLSDEEVEALFKDVTIGGDHAEGIHFLAEKGIIAGYPTGEFKPWDSIKREHVATILKNASHIDDPDEADIEKILSIYKDVDASYYYAKEIAAVTKAKVFTGSEGYFSPGNPITREQMATVLVSALDLDQYLPDESVTINLANVDPSHQASVQVLASLGITNQLDDFRPHEPISRGAFSTFLYEAMQVKFAAEDEETAA